LYMRLSEQPALSFKYALASAAERKFDTVRGVHLIVFRGAMLEAPVKWF